MHAAAQLVGSAQSLALVCHVNPDGDALGSMLGMAVAADNAGKAVSASWPGGQIPRSYRNLPGQHLVIEPSLWRKAALDADVVMTFDCGSLDRLDDLAPAAVAAKKRGALVVIDHHLTNEGFGSTNVIDPTAAASSVVVRDLLAALRWPLTRDVAWCLYAALATDTGRFQFSSTTPAVFHLAEELAGFDVPVAAISRELFEESPLAVLRLSGEVLSACELVPIDGEFNAVVATVSAEQLSRHGVDISSTEPLIDWVRRAEEAEVAVVLKETLDGRTRGSMRSLGAVDVAAVACALGGGGHRFAAGFTVSAPLGGTRAEVLNLLRSQCATTAESARKPRG